MTSLTVLLSLLCLFAIAWANKRDDQPSDRDKPIAELQGRVYIKSKKLNRFLIIDPLTEDPEPRAMLWNVPDVIPPRGGAWWYLQKSPTKETFDYNLIGGEDWNYTLCVSMLQPEGEKFYHYLQGYIDNYHYEAPQCRWQISLSLDNENFWIINKLYGGHMLAPDHTFNVHPLRRLVFQSLQVTGEDDNEVWEIARVLQPSNKPKEDED